MKTLTTFLTLAMLSTPAFAGDIPSVHRDGQQVGMHRFNPPGVEAGTCAGTIRRYSTNGNYSNILIGSTYDAIRGKSESYGFIENGYFQRLFKGKPVGPEIKVSSNLDDQINLLKSEATTCPGYLALW